ncbi:MAG: MotA/TolQ/ExbB proton channel family protein [Flavobacteriaceae bacterium]|nr:MotA/TolQ/ExbB proton channel family protein [Flavobacteriaceae bacterium]
MRMPFTEFITGGDLKFVIVFVIFAAVAIFHFVKKLKAKMQPENEEVFNYHKTKINTAAFWLLILSVFSLLLGLMHSFYHIGKAGGIAPSLIFQGVANALITPVLGISLFIICKTLAGTFNLKIAKQS